MLGETVIHRRYEQTGEGGDFGEAIYRWVETPVHNVGVDIRSNTEVVDHTTGQPVLVDATLFLPAGFVCDTKDEFIIRGVNYRVFGAAIALNNMFTGHGFHTEINLRRRDN